MKAHKEGCIMSSRFNAPKSVVKSIVADQRIRSALDSLRAPFFGDEAEAQCFRQFVRGLGGPLKFAHHILGEDEVKFLRKHLRTVRKEDPDNNLPSFVELVMGVKPTYAADGPSAAFKAVFETEVARKAYVQTVEGREVPAFELDTSETLSNKVVIPYVRNKDGVVMTQAHYKKALGIKMDPKNEEWDRRPVLEIFITRKGGGVKLAVPAMIKLRQEYDVALKQAVDAMNMAKQRGSFDPNVKLLFQAAADKKIPWLLLRDAFKSFSQRVANDGKTMSLDTGFGPWPCHTMEFTKGNFILAVRVLKDDMTPAAKEARKAYVAKWKEEQKAMRLKEAMDQAGDIPMV
jgi:hypothetical protein